MRPSKRRRFTELVRFGFNVGGRAGGDEPSDQQVAHILATKTISWTLRRSTSQFCLMSEILGELPHLRKSWLDVSTSYAEDCLAVIAAGIDQWTRAAVDDPTLQAILKLHNCPEPGRFLDLPKRLAA